MAGGSEKIEEHEWTLHQDRRRLDFASVDCSRLQVDVLTRSTLASYAQIEWPCVSRYNAVCAGCLPELPSRDNQGHSLVRLEDATLLNSSCGCVGPGFHVSISGVCEHSRSVRPLHNILQSRRLATQMLPLWNPYEEKETRQPLLQ